MNPVISAQLQEFAKSYSITDLRRETQFDIYSIFSVLNGLLGESIEPCEVHLAGNEFGIDGIAILIQGELVHNSDEASEKLSRIKNPSIEFAFFFKPRRARAMSMEKFLNSSML